MREIALAKIRPNKRQPRTTFDEAALASLVDSIRAVGILQPVLVREVGDDEYELIAGERRWRAARRAGLIAIPALVQVADDEASLEQALVENIHREGLNPLDEAAGYQQLIEDFHLTHDAVAHRVGKSRAAVTNAIRLFQLPPAVQRFIRDGQLSAGHARALLMTPDRNLQERLARKSVEEELSVRGLELLVHGSEPPSQGAQNEQMTAPAPPAAARLRPPGVLELEELLAAHFNTRVRVEMNRHRGRVTIEFAGLEDLERIYRLMIGEPSTSA
jgi:ParB family transcriptional regulator, chromosome partitioning protein